MLQKKKEDCLALSSIEIQSVNVNKPHHTENFTRSTIRLFFFFIVKQDLLAVMLQKIKLTASDHSDLRVQQHCIKQIDS